MGNNSVALNSIWENPTAEKTLIGFTHVKNYGHTLDYSARCEKQHVGRSNTNKSNARKKNNPAVIPDQ